MDFEKGEVQKRTDGKAYGVIFTDLILRAVHIEAVYGYDTSSFLMAISRFTNIRGWPEYIYSDPGSQLIGVERVLKAWQKIDCSELHKSGVQSGLTWVYACRICCRRYESFKNAMLFGLKRTRGFGCA